MPNEPKPMGKQGGRLGIPPEQAVEHFRQAVEAYDQVNLLAACGPIKALRLAGIGVKIALPSRPRASVAGRLFEGGESD